MDRENLARKIEADLKNSRLLKRSSPDNPINSTKIIAAYEKQEIFLNDSEIREAVNWGRKHGLKIGSTLRGYYYVLRSDEWDKTLEHIMPRFLDLKAVIDKIKQNQSEMRAEETGQELFNDKFQYLKKELDLMKA